MPYKKCDNCGEPNGVRSKRCKKCDTEFFIKPRVDVEPGTWASEPRRGLPRLEYPEPIQGDEKYDNEWIRNAITDEGLGYCIWQYISPQNIGDPELARRWTAARSALKSIVEYVYFGSPTSKDKLQT